MPRSRSFTRLTMRVGLLHLGQSVDFVGSISFLRSPVFAILAIGGVFLLLGLSLHTPAQAGGFNGAVLGSLVRDLRRKKSAQATQLPSEERGQQSRTRLSQFTSVR